LVSGVPPASPGPEIAERERERWERERRRGSREREALERESVGERENRGERERGNLKEGESVGATVGRLGGSRWKNGEERKEKKREEKKNGYFKY